MNSPNTRHKTRHSVYNPSCIIDHSVIVSLHFINIYDYLWKMVIVVYWSAVKRIEAQFMALKKFYLKIGCKFILPIAINLSGR